jgi:hypothetical protein
MSSNYVVSRIKEALYNANGNKKLAGEQIQAWAMEDIQLLKGLARAHLGGIVAYHIDRVASGKDVPATNQTIQKPAAASKGRSTIEPMQTSAFGREILRSAARANASVFGLESYESPTKPAKTSQRHIDALNHIAAIHKSVSPTKYK